MNKENFKKRLLESKDITEFLNILSKAVNPKIKQLLNSGIDKRFFSIVNYQINSGGKKVRPALVVLSALTLGGNINEAINFASAVEIFHNESLIIDDIIDESFWRRNKLTCWKKFGESTALCINMIYAASYFESLKFNKFKKEILLRLVKIMKDVSEGEILDILFEQGGRNNEPFVVQNRYRKIKLNEYLLMVSKKTASLIANSCVIGGLCANASSKYLKALESFGVNIGIMFQIKDDILDFYGRKKELGKKEGQDIREHKLGNILTLYALKELSKKDKNQLLRILRKNKIMEKDVKIALKLIRKTKAKQKAEKLANRFLKKSKENLYILPKNKWRDKLENLSEFILKRQK